MSEKKSWKTIKVRENSYEALKKMGTGISKAIDVLLQVQQQKIEEKINDLRGIGNSIAEVLFRYGVFDVKLKGATITGVEEYGDTITVFGEVDISIPHDEVREKILEILRGKEDVRGGNQGADASDR